MTASGRSLYGDAGTPVLSWDPLKYAMDLELGYRAWERTKKIGTLEEDHSWGKH
jgi:hypothetical protein